MSSMNNDSNCRLIDDCPLFENCKSDGEANYSHCPMKYWSFDEILAEPASCSECVSLNKFEMTNNEELTNQDRKDLSLYWMEHLNHHLQRFEPQSQGTESEQS